MTSTYNCCKRHKEEFDSLDDLIITFQSGEFTNLLSYLTIFEPYCSGVRLIQPFWQSIMILKLRTMAYTLSTEARLSLKIKLSGFDFYLWKVKGYDCPLPCSLTQLLCLIMYKMLKSLFWLLFLLCFNFV